MNLTQQLLLGIMLVGLIFCGLLGYGLWILPKLIREPRQLLTQEVSDEFDNIDRRFYEQAESIGTLATRIENVHREGSTTAAALDQRISDYWEHVDGLTREVLRQAGLNT